MVKVKMWEIHKKLKEFPKKTYFTKTFKSKKEATKLVREWNQFDNPYDRIGLGWRGKPKSDTKKKKYWK